MNNLLLFAVGKEYVDLLVEYQKYIPNNFNVTVYTTDVQTIKKHLSNVNVIQYKSEVFHYFDKFKYSIELSNQLKESVLYMDVGRLCESNDDILNIDFSKVKNICFTNTWGGEETADKIYDIKNNLLENGYFNDILDLFKKTVELNKIPLFIERIFIVPFKKSMNVILNELEQIRKLFENLSVTKKNVYSGIGNGEGFAMGYVISKRNEPYDFVEKYINKII